MISPRSIVVCAALCVTLGACGLEARPGAVGPQSPTPTPSTNDVAQPLSPGDDYQRVELGKGVDGFVPTDTRWRVLTEQASTGQVVRIIDASSRISILLQVTSTSETAEQLCGRAIGGLVAGTGITPAPHEAGVNTPTGVSAFSCSATGLPDNGNDIGIPAESTTSQSSVTPTPSQSSTSSSSSAPSSAASSAQPQTSSQVSRGPGTFDVLVDVAVRATDDIGYVQITRIDTAVTGADREKVTRIAQEILAVTTTNME